MQWPVEGGTDLPLCGIALLGCELRLQHHRRAVGPVVLVVIGLFLFVIVVVLVVPALCEHSLMQRAHVGDSVAALFAADVEPDARPLAVAQALDLAENLAAVPPDR